MRRRTAGALGVLAVATILLSGCTTGVGQSEAGAGGLDDKTPVTISLWSFFTAREKGDVDARLTAFHKLYPWITVDHVGGESDDNIVQSVRGGNPPDVAISQNSDSVSGYCATGTFQDLTSRIAAAGSATSSVLPATAAYTSYDGKRCALPVLADVYGLYYNTDMFQKAGITAPPRTWPELTEDAKKLTTFNPDGSIKVAGFVPFLDFFENNVGTFTPGFDLDWYDAAGKAQMANDPNWAAMFTWEKQLVDWYGYDKLQTYVASLGAEFSPQNPFQTGKLAMAVDGEWRVAFAADQAKRFSYGTAPMPTTSASRYGSGVISGTTIGIPKGSKHSAAAWLLVKYLSTDTSSLVDLTLRLRNVPTTTQSLADPAIRTDPRFTTMLDIAADKDTRSVPGTWAGSAPRELLTQFAQAWAAGNVPDLHAGLASVADQIDSQIDQASAGESR